jgi:hypothetical protein
MGIGQIVQLLYTPKDNETNWRTEFAQGVEARFNAFQMKYREAQLQAVLVMAYISGKQDYMIDKAYTKFIDIYLDRDTKGSQPRNFPINLLTDPFKTQLYYLINADPPMEVKSALNRDNKKQHTAEVITNTFKYLENNVWGWTRYRGVSCNDGLQHGTVIGELYPMSLNGRVELGLKHRTIWDIATSEDAEGCLIDEDTIQILRDVKSLGWLKENYKDALPVMAEIAGKLSVECEPPTNQFQADMAQALGYDKMQSTYKLSGDDRQVVIYAVYHKPTGEYPKGWYQVVSMGKEIAFSEALPISKDDKSVMPLTQFDTNGVITARKIKDSPFTDSLPSQTLYNMLLNNLAASGLLGAKPPISQYAGVMILDKDNKPAPNQYPKFGDTFRWSLSDALEARLGQNPALWGAIKPDFMQTPAMNGVVVELINEIKQGIINSTSQAFANPGSMNKNDASGKALNIQGQIDQMGNRPTIELWFDYKKRLYKKVMTAISCIYPADTLALILDDKQGYEVKDFAAEDIDDSFDVEFTISSETPATMGGKINQLAGLKGILGEQWFEKIDAQALKLLNKGGIIDKDTDPDLELADAENDKITHDAELIKALSVMVPAEIIDPISGMPYDQPTTAAEHAMRMWTNMFQNDKRHVSRHLPLVAGPDSLTNGTQITTIAGYHVKAHYDMEEMKKPKLPVAPVPRQPGQPEQPTQSDVQF